MQQPFLNQEENTPRVLMTIDSTVECTMRRTSFPTGSRPRPRCFPYVLHPPVVHCWCATDLGSQDGPAASFACHADAACSTGQVGDPCSHVPLSDDAQHAAPAGPPHTTRHNHVRCDGAVPFARHAGAQLPRQKAGSSSEDQLRHEGGQAETPVADRQEQK